VKLRKIEGSEHPADIFKIECSEQPADIFKCLPKVSFMKHGQNMVTWWEKAALIIYILYIK
jgi:hypothetical protein